jgi:uncharacterized protein YodC (DUF2158 family)
MLRSGGPKMTVEGTDEEGELTCVWFDGKKSKRDAFPSVALVAVDPASPEDAG